VRAIYRSVSDVYRTTPNCFVDDVRTPGTIENQDAHGRVVVDDIGDRFYGPRVARLEYDHVVQRRRCEFT
jgi:hypothetical protein